MRHAARSGVGLLALLACASEPTPFDATLPTAIEITPSAVNLTSVGETTQLRATVRNGRGAELAGATVSWMSGSPTIATVDGSGLVTAVTTGRAEINATIGSLVARASIDISQQLAEIRLSPDTIRFVSVGDTTTITIQAHDARGNPIPSPSVQWSSLDARAVSVNSSGLVTAIRNGSSTISAQGGLARADVRVIVDQVVASTVVAPLLDTLESVSDTIVLQAVTRDARGNLVAAVALVWTSSAPAVATVDPSGLVVSRADGLATITATPSGGPAGQAAIRVRQRPVRLVWGSLPPNLLRGLGLTGVQVRVEDARGNPVAAASDPVGLRLTPGSANGVLTGPQAIVPTRGAADLGPTAISLPGLNYRLTATFPGLAEVTTPLFSVYHRFASLQSGGAYVCARDQAAATWCWGDNSSSQLLLSSVTESSFPVRAPGLDRFRPLLLGGATACGVEANQLYCWANIDFPPLAAPAAVSGGLGLTGFFLQGIENHGCGLQNGAMVCWGIFNPLFTFAAPVQLVPGPMGVRFVAGGAGSSLGCAISSARALYCFGNNPEGEIGDGSTTFRSALTLVAGGRQYAAVDAGVDHTCAVTTTGSLYCWGDNRAGQLGDPTLGPRSTIPVLVPVPVRLTTVSIGFYHGCGLGVDQQVYCWGRGLNGEIGTGLDHQLENAVQRVSLPDPVAAVEVGAFHSCALTTRGQAFCWGLNTSGQRGDGGATGAAFVPSAVGVQP